MKKRKKIISLASSIEGQEAERLRIAKDLHDGLGGILSTIKIHFSNIESEIKDTVSSKVFSKTDSMIDKACHEVRRISHNLMPGTLRLEGLRSAIENMADEMSEISFISSADRIRRLHR